MLISNTVAIFKAPVNYQEVVDHYKQQDLRHRIEETRKAKHTVKSNVTAVIPNKNNEKQILSKSNKIFFFFV
jgi:hypothetical protein